MARDGSWGDGLGLLASAHILHCPLWVITDSESPEPREYIRKVCPPPIIDESCWGPPVFLAASLDRHFDSTQEPRKCLVAPFAWGMLIAPESFQGKE